MATRRTASRKKLRRAGSLVLYWEDGQLVCEDYLRRERCAVSPAVVDLLDQFGTPRGPKSAASLEANPAELRRTIESLTRQGLLTSSESKQQKALKSWRWGAAARHFLFGTKGANVHVSRRRRLAYARKLMALSRQPSSYKEYPGRKRITLPKPPSFASAVGPLLSSVRDVRRFERRPIPKDWLSEILLLSCGEQGRISEQPWGELVLKTHYSAGYRHPTEVYPVVVSADGLAAGLYHYNVRRHGLELLRRGDFSRQAREIAGGQTWVKNAAVYLLMTAVFERTSFKYRDDSFLRSVFMDAGHVAQSVGIVAKSLGLGACATHALRHDKAEDFLGIDGVRESFLYMVMLGRPQDLDQDALISPYRGVPRGRRSASYGAAGTPSVSRAARSSGQPEG